MAVEALMLAVPAGTVSQIKNAKAYGIGYESVFRIDDDLIPNIQSSLYAVLAWAIVQICLKFSLF